MNTDEAMAVLSRHVSSITDQHAIGVLQSAYRLCCSIEQTKKDAGLHAQAMGASACANALAVVVAEMSKGLTP